jgi:hypothetical protein
VRLDANDKRLQLLLQFGKTLQDNLLSPEASVGLHLQIELVGFRIVVERFVVSRRLLFVCIGTNGPFLTSILLEPVRGVSEFVVGVILHADVCTW